MRKSKLEKLEANQRAIEAKLCGERAVFAIEGHSGLTLHARGDGSGSWVLRYTALGKQREHTLHSDAKHAKFSAVKEAKEKWLATIKLQSLDPKREIEAAIAASKVEGLTFGEVYEQWVAAPREKKTLRPRTAALYRWVYSKHLADGIGRRPIIGITKADLRTFFPELLVRITSDKARALQTGRGEVAGKAFTYAKSAFTYAVAQDIITANPMIGLVRPLPKEPAQKATRPLRPDELRKIWLGADEHLAADQVRMIKLALLLGRRRTEIAEAVVLELTLYGGSPEWLIPAREGNKSGMESLVPLPHQAANIMRDAAAAAATKGSLYLFPKSRNTGGGDAPTNPDSLSHAWRRLCNVVGVPDEVELHGARDLITDALLRMGAPSLVVSYVLHHSADMRSTVALKNYRTHEFYDEKLRALRLWAIALSAIVRGRKPLGLRWHA